MKYIKIIIFLGLMNAIGCKAQYMSIISDAKSYVFRVVVSGSQIAFEKPCEMVSCLLYGAGQTIPFGKSDGFDVPQGTHKIVGTIETQGPLRLVVEAYTYDKNAVDDFYRGASKSTKTFTIHHDAVSQSRSVELTINYSWASGFSVTSKTSGVKIK